MTSAVPEEYVPAVREESAIVRAAPGDVVVAFEEYRKIQSALDASLPDCVMDIRGKKFRKKNYWRAVATAFNLTLELISERREEYGDDWGYLCTYRATAPNGRYADGDGTCFASEKGKGQDSVHNVRSHAATRAANRAISNLVGFGEVSAEEMIGGQRRQSSPPPRERSVPTEGDAWLDSKMIGKKYNKETWRHMIQGSVGGERHSYLEYMRDWLQGKLAEEPSGKYAAKNTADLQRVEACLTMISNRADQGAEEEPPLPGDEEF